MSDDSDDSQSTDTTGYKNWIHDLTELQDIGEEILKEWNEEKEHSPRDYPTVEWLRNNGYSHLRWILREKHNIGTPEFFILLTSAGGSEGYEWHIESVATIQQFERYLDDRVSCRNWNEATRRTQKSRINTMAKHFAEEYGEDNLIALANDLSVQTDVYLAFKTIIKNLRKESISDESVHQYVRAIHRVYESLARSSRIAYDPMEDIEEEFRWEWDSEATPLTPEQIRRLWETAETAAERLLVVGYCVWGVRTSELPGVHRDQIHFDKQDPHVTFTDSQRKNGPGEVSLIFGLGPLAELLDQRSDQPNWNGYLFPSDSNQRSFLSSDQMRERFKSLCEKANVKINDNVATPKHGRSFYYGVLADAETDLLETATKIAEEQASEDAETVRDRYLTEEKRRKYRRVFFRQRLRRIFPKDAYDEYRTPINDDFSIDEF